MKTTKPYKLPSGHALVLRCTNADGLSSRGFIWPGVGVTAKAPDWDPEPECGHGLHGWLYGQGDHTAANINDDSRWLVVEVEESTIVMLVGKCKFPAGKVVFVGSRSEAADFIFAHEPRAASLGVIGRIAKVGDHESVLVGALGSATAGYRGTATAGEGGSATAGYRGTATAGYRGSATAGNYGSATAGEGGSATAGNYGSATAGNYGSATAGYRGSATAGYRGTATAGYRGSATAGEGGSVTAGEGGELHIRYRDGKRFRLASAYVGEKGIKADTSYRLDDNGKFVEASK